jgi:hypothetical protein
LRVSLGRSIYKITDSSRQIQFLVAGTAGPFLAMVLVVMRLPGTFRLPIVIALLVIIGSLAGAQAAFAQYQGHNFKGDFGVNSGSQPGPGIYVALPYGQWNADAIKDADGNLFAGQFNGFDLRLVPVTAVVVTKKKFLGANYGFMAAVPFSKIRPESVADDVDDSQWGFTDTYVVPLYLGWHTPRADYVAGYGFTAPTGRYEPRATDNVGLGMWSHEIQAGVTAYLDEAKKLSVATTGYLELHSKKKDLDLKVGNLLTLEGGAAYNVPAIGGAFGVAYYLQNKLSDDSGADIPELLLRSANLRGRSRIFGIGPDVTMGLFQRGATAGLVNVKYLWDSAAKTSFEGGTFWMSFTLAQLRP